MSLLKRFYDLLFAKASAEIDAASDPEDKVRLALHQLEDTAPAIREAVSGPIAEANLLEEKKKVIAANVADLESKVAQAVAANNTPVAKIWGGQLLDQRKNLADIDARLATANVAAATARERYDDWKKKSSELHDKAMATLDTNQRAAAQEQFNAAMRSIDENAIDSSLSQAMESISERAARADAQATLDVDPAQQQLKDFEKATRDSDIDKLLAGFKPQAANEATATS